jgi:hypothetical protein
VKTEFLNAAGLAASSLAGRGVMQSRQTNEALFQHALSAATEEQKTAAEAKTTDAVATRSIWRDEHSRGVIETGSQSADRSAATDTTGSGTGSTGLFGPDQNQNVGLGESAEWADFFKTHAPAEWSSHAVARAKFAETYSPEALVTLDWTGTVPENIDSNFVTRCEVDASGKPLPTNSFTELT